MGNKDVMCEACTGSGKTLSFVIPALHRLLKLTENSNDSSITYAFSVLILSPTRELATQTNAVIVGLLDKIKECKLKTLTCVGGVTKIDENLEIIKNSEPEIIIATPGRLEDLMNRSEIVRAKLKQLEGQSPNLAKALSR